MVIVEEFSIDINALRAILKQLIRKETGLMDQPLFVYISSLKLFMVFIN